MAGAQLVDGDDLEAVGAVGVQGERHAGHVSGDALKLLPLPRALLSVLLLAALHDERWRRRAAHAITSPHHGRLQQLSFYPQCTGT